MVYSAPLSFHLYFFTNNEASLFFPILFIHFLPFLNLAVFLISRLVLPAFLFYHCFSCLVLVTSIFFLFPVFSEYHLLFLKVLTPLWSPMVFLCITFYSATAFICWKKTNKLSISVVLKTHLIASICFFSHRILKKKKKNRLYLR